MSLPYSHSSARPAQIGLIVLQSDETLERDMRMLLPAEIEILVSRVPSGTSVTQDSLRAMESELTGAAELLPRGATCSAVAYGCTSGAAEIGAERVASLVQAGVDTPNVTEPVSALVAACRHLGLRQVGLISPYIAAVSDQLRRVLNGAEISVSAFESFDEPVEAKVARISPASIATAAIEMGNRSDCDAVFLSCTNLRTLDIIDQVEAQIGKPVLASNQVLAWHLGKLADMRPAPSGPGALLD